MKIVPSVLVGSMSGSSGGTTVANWKGRLYARRRVIPKNPRSTAQQTQRGYMKRMSPWWRSLSTDVQIFLDDLGSPLQLSGFNVMSGTNLKLLAASTPPIIVPGNPKATSLFGATDTPSVVSSTLEVEFEAGEADQAFFVHAFSVPVDPAASGVEEPDSWTWDSTPVLVSADTYTGIAVLNGDVDYYVALLVADTNDLSSATVLSGGIGLIAHSFA